MIGLFTVARADMRFTKKRSTRIATIIMFIFKKDIPSLTIPRILRHFQLRQSDS